MSRHDASRPAIGPLDPPAATSSPSAAVRSSLFWPKAAAHALALAPFAWLIWRIRHGELSADPIADITHFTGIWALRMLLLSLAVTPLRKLTGLAVAIRFRRLLGLYAFFYATLHSATYLVLDLGGYWPQIFDDVVRRPFMTVGFLAWLLLVPLAATSTLWAIRKLKRNWARLHRLVYAIGALAVLHFAWSRKAGEQLAQDEPLLYAGIFFVLMALRLPWQRWLSGSRATTAR